MDELIERIEDVLDRWDATDEVDTTFGVEIEELGRELAAALREQAGGLPEDEPRRAELIRAADDLTEVVEEYTHLDEHDTNYSVDIVDRLGPALGLVTEDVTV